MKYYIIAGEPSGDLHASNLMKKIVVNDPEAEIRFWGGDLMKTVGGEMVKHYNDTAFMGIFEVIANLRTIQKNFRFCETNLMEFNPDVLILVDYPGFNLRMAKYAHMMGIKVFYYISPKLWAWNTKRVKKVKAYVDKMFTILPFETEFYRKHGVNVDYVGNPVLDAIEQRENKNEDIKTFKNRNQLDSRPIVGILAGSRRMELNRMLPQMLKMVEKYPEFQFVIAGAPSFEKNDYAPFIKNKDVKVLFNETYAILQHATAAMVTSGTATLEAALLNCPQVVCYQAAGGKFSDILVKKIVMKVPFVSLVNLILNKESVLELIQSAFSIEALEKEMELLLKNKDRREQIFSDYQALQEKMGSPGSSEKAANLMNHYLKMQ